VRKLLLYLLLALPGPAPSVRAADAPLPEYTVKAALLLKLARFVVWPAAAESRPEFVLCVLGADPFRSALDPLATQKVRNRPVRVLQVEAPDQVAAKCDMVYLSEQDRLRLSQSLSHVRGTPVLTVGDAEAFAQAGGMIGMATRNRRLTFEINLAPSREAGLEFKSQLLQLATLVGSKRDGSAP
jgi:hypothetical protein